MVMRLKSEEVLRIKRPQFKKVLKIVTICFVLYIAYAFIFGVLIFNFHSHKNTDYLETHSVHRFWGNEEGQDRVVLMEERYESGLARIDLIDGAKETLDISYYTIHDGLAANVFYGCILEAANRGVQVRLLLDGMFHNLKGDLKDVLYVFADHPNIELKLYEPLSLIRPWTWNNRLHDKFIIADNQFAIIGGRNIGDKYFADEGYDGTTVDDRDVVIINTDTDNQEDSVIYQMIDYFNYVWNHEISKYPTPRLSNRQIRKGEKKSAYLSKFMESMKESNPDIFDNSIDWMNLSVPTNKITLIHNPIDMFNKEPWCWYEITNLIENSKESIFIQSPYVIPTDNMISHLGDIRVSPNDIHILTNSLASTPNVLAYSGHIRYREKIVDYGASVYEFQGSNSIHAKTFIFDDRISLIGSFNVDPRSTYLSTETMVVIDSEEFAKTLKDTTKGQINKSLQVSKDYSYVHSELVKERNVSFRKKTIVSAISMFTYFFHQML